MAGKRKAKSLAELIIEGITNTIRSLTSFDDEITKKYLAAWESFFATIRSDECVPGVWRPLPKIRAQKVTKKRAPPKAGVSRPNKRTLTEQEAAEVMPRLSQAGSDITAKYLEEEEVHPKTRILEHII